jgi:hypothetical protein
LILLEKKLAGICESTQFVESKCKWKKQLLHIWAFDGLENKSFLRALFNRYFFDFSTFPFHSLMINCDILLCVQIENAATTLVEAYKKCGEKLKSDTLIIVTCCPTLPEEQLLGINLIERIFFSESSAAVRFHTVTIGKVKSVFVKEIAAIKKIKVSEVSGCDFSLSDQILSCNHILQGDKIGGPLCVVCGYPTSKRVWKCSHGCGVTLCGSCAWKWKEKLCR